MARSKELNAATRALNEITNTKYCQSCCRGAPVEGGKDIVNNKGRRYGWRCKACVDRRTAQVEINEGKKP